MALWECKYFKTDFLITKNCHISSQTWFISPVFYVDKDLFMRIKKKKKTDCRYVSLMRSVSWACWLILGIYLTLTLKNFLQLSFTQITLAFFKRLINSFKSRDIPSFKQLLKKIKPKLFNRLSPNKIFLQLTLPNSPLMS